ncbi:4-hydroxyphenylpyruvate dioxygenase family protein [Pararobbsia silviterrae]|uniref:4-hydroxyphenylpyruvate dioxygenase n=1 Tax=Pararobbsia silviterrae TaxID=1792498 RepID=A0A494Y1K6_9BURK|nr:VOC family protein [Pararobbsia silviterrae]RKP55888.1 4-hydroxyphenylpyruvate dioxygenase [Pararobbsia silviterrae]
MNSDFQNSVKRPGNVLETHANPLGTAGLEFVEFAASDSQTLGKLFEQLGFTSVARHLSKNVTLYRQGRMHFLLNAEPDSFAARFAGEYGAGVCAIGIRVDDAARAFESAIDLGAWAFEGERIGSSELAIPAIQGIGDSHIYFVDRWRGRDAGPARGTSIFDIDFRAIDEAAKPVEGVYPGAGLVDVDHLTQTVAPGGMQEWLDFYRDLLNFREIHELHENWHVSPDARVMVSPCGGVQIPLYEEGTRRTALMHSYLPDHPGQGVQHIALSSADIFASVDALLANGVELISPPPRYYEQIEARLPGHGLDLDALARRSVLVDGEIDAQGRARLFLQTFVARRTGEIFFEIVERRGHHGFGEGNLDALARAR